MLHVRFESYPDTLATQLRVRHQALHNLVARSPWSDQTRLMEVAHQVLTYFSTEAPRYWIIDNTAIRKKGRHAVGVSRQYCGEIDKQDNCQAAVSLSVTTEQASLPLAWRLYLPTSWMGHPGRCRKAGVSADVSFATKSDAALQQINQTLEEGALNRALFWLMPLMEKNHMA